MSPARGSRRKFRKGSRVETFLSWAPEGWKPGVGREDLGTGRLRIPECRRPEPHFLQEPLEKTSSPRELGCPGKQGRVGNNLCLSWERLRETPAFPSSTKWKQFKKTFGAFQRSLKASEKKQHSPLLGTWGAPEPEGAVCVGTGPPAEAARPGDCGVPEEPQRTSGQAEGRAEREDGRQRQPQAPPERTQWDFTERQPGTPTCLPAPWGPHAIQPRGRPSSFLAAGREEGERLCGYTNPQRGREPWLNFSPDLVSDWGNLKWRSQVFSTGDWWLMSLLDSFLGNHCYFYIDAVCTQVQRYTKYIPNAVGKLKEEDIFLGWGSEQP